MTAPSASELRLVPAERSTDTEARASSSAGMAPTPLTSLPEPADADAPALVIACLYERHHRMVRALCQLLLRNATDAEDATQQTFLSAFASLIDGTVPRNAAAWLATIARRECWARTAQRRRQPLQLDDTAADSQVSSALDEAVRNADLAALWNAINALPRQQRAAFLLREFSGLSYAEVAAALGATESAVETLLVRARRQLRDGLQPALRTANLIATTLLLLRHRLARLLDPRLAGGTVGKAAATSATIKLGAAVTGVLVVVAGSVGVGVHTLGRHPHVGAASPAAGPSARPGTAESPVATGSALGSTSTDRLVSRNQAHLAALPDNVDTAPGSTSQESATTGSATDSSPGGAEQTSDGSTASTTDGQPPTASTASTETSADASQPITTSSSGDAPSGDTTPNDAASADSNPADTISTDATPAEPTQEGSTDNPTQPPQPSSPATP
jgi:RNA polymerase sigma-70 factor, ECF subfamily